MAGAVNEFGHAIVKGQAELEKAFLQLRKEVLVGLKPAILEVADIVRNEAVFQVTEGQDRISHIGPQWSQVRIGVTPKLAYIAPKMRRRAGASRRPNLAPLLARAYQDAADRKADEFLARIDELVTVSAASSGLL